MAASNNFTVKLTLDRANLVREALDVYRKQLWDKATKIKNENPGMLGDEDHPAYDEWRTMGAKAMDIDTLLRTEF